MKQRNADGTGKLVRMAMSVDVSGAPSEVQLLPAGFHETGQGNFLLDEIAAKLILSAAITHKNDLVIDYEHQTLKDVEAPAAGWISKLVNKGPLGIWGTVSWTKRAQDYLNNREYRYLSPVFLRDKDGRPVKIINAALTNQPAIDGMIPVVNKSQDGGIPAETQKEDTSNMEQILKALGLAATATVEEALTAIDALKNAGQQVACKGILTALGLKADATESEATGTILAMKTGAETTASLTQKVNDLTGKLAARDAAELVQVAMKEGKITPAQKEWAVNYAKSDPEGFKVFVAKAAPVIPGDMSPAAPDKKPDELSETEMVVCKQMGLSKEDFLKHRGTK